MGLKVQLGSWTHTEQTSINVDGKAVCLPDHLYV